MLISIITTSFNSAATIRDTLRSVADQRYPHVEHVIIDGASRDHTLDIVGEFPHVAKTVSEKDHGIYDAMNKGIRHCTGEIVGILNSDDFYAHEHVLERVAKLFANPEVMAVYADLNYVHPVDTGRVIRHWRSGPFRREQFYSGWMPPHPTFFVRRALYDRFGRFNTELRSAADYELMLRFLLKEEVDAVYLPEVTVHMRTGGSSNASLRNRWRANREDKRAWALNGLRPGFFTVYLKPLRKLAQYWLR